MTRLIKLAIITITSLFLFHCSDNEEPLTEPVAPIDGTESYPEDPSFQDQDPVPEPEPRTEKKMAEEDPFKKEMEDIDTDTVDATLTPSKIEPRPQDETAAVEEIGSNRMYVDAVLLNVRNDPAIGGRIIKRLKGGQAVEVRSINGRFTEIAPGEFVASQYLSSTPTRVVTDEEVDRAWESSPYKDTWRP